MSYCVHCGVKLASYHKQCPLCDTEVQDPNPSGNDIQRYVDRLDITDKNVNRYFLTRLLTSILLIPVFVSCLVNLLISKHLSWSLYVTGAIILFWIWVIFPYRYHFKKPYLYFFIDYLASSVYVFIIYYLTSGENWFWFVGLPIISCTFIWILSILFILRRSLSAIGYFGWLAVSTSLLPLFINIIINFFTKHSISPTWSLWVFVPLSSLGIIVIIISKSIRLSKWIEKKLFI